MCGLFIYEISSGAPNLTNVSITSLHSELCKFVVSFPSEKVPAPPSPNCTFEQVFNIRSFKNNSTSFCLSSTVLPCSTIIGLTPFSIRVSAQNSPAGPAPIITGLLLAFKSLCNTVFCFCSCSIKLAFLFFNNLLTLKSSFKKTIRE